MASFTLPCHQLSAVPTQAHGAYDAGAGGSAPNEDFHHGKNALLYSPPSLLSWEDKGDTLSELPLPIAGGSSCGVGGGGALTSAAKNGAAAGIKPTKKPLSAFLQKLRDIVDKSGGPHCLWGTTGDSLVVTDSSKFAVETLPLYFRTKNFSSFLRQLHFYGFRKTDRGKNAWEFRHAYFLKDKPELMSRIQRKVAGSSGHGGSNGESTAANKAAGDSIEYMKGRIGCLEDKMQMISTQMSSMLAALTRGDGAGNPRPTGRNIDGRTCVGVWVVCG